VETPSVRTFLWMWLGQTVSLVGSGLTRFALGVWVYQQTGSATRFSLILLFSVLPAIVVSPFAGVVVDRCDRRRILLAANAAAALGVLAVAVLLWTDRLAVWHVYAGVSLSSVADAFQRPAFDSTTRLLVPASHLGRAAGLTQAGQAAERVLSPLLAGVVMVTAGLPGVLVIDAVSYGVSFATLAALRLPSPSAPAGRTPLRRDLATGLRYIRGDAGLVGLVLFFMMLNLGMGITHALLTPFVLSFATARELGTVLSVAGLGTLAGSATMGIWGGPRRRVHGVVGGGVLLGVCMALVGARASLPLVAVACLGLFLSVPLVNACNQAIWLARVPPELQGRVLATRSMLCWCTTPVAYLVSGPLVEGLIAPLRARGGLLATALAAIAGTGPGRDMGAALVLVGTLLGAAACAASLSPRVRGVEDSVPAADPATGLVPGTVLPLPRVVA
jgi:hypothetical protein